MARNDMPRRYGSLAIAFHWTLAAAILAALPLGLLAARASDDGRAAALLRIHVPLGMLILILTLARAAWRYRHRPPPAPAGLPRWQAGAARVSHALLYILPVAVAASGIALLALSGAAPILFSRVQGALPDFSRFPPMAVHALGAFALIGLVCLHLAAVIHHQFVRRDRLLARMGIGSLPAPHGDAGPAGVTAAAGTPHARRGSSPPRHSSAGRG